MYTVAEWTESGLKYKYTTLQLIQAQEPGSVDTQLHSFQCKVLADNIHMEGNYSEIFTTTNIDKNIARKLENIEKFREELLENAKWKF